LKFNDLFGVTIQTLLVEVAEITDVGKLSVTPLKGTFKIWRSDFGLLWAVSSVALHAIAAAKSLLKIGQNLCISVSLKSNIWLAQIARGLDSESCLQGVSAHFLLALIREENERAFLDRAWRKAFRGGSASPHLACGKCGSAKQATTSVLGAGWKVLLSPFGTIPVEDVGANAIA
jgi:hypothetical protein